MSNSGLWDFGEQNHHQPYGSRLCPAIWNKKFRPKVKLQILITQYKETDEVLKPMLDSIMFQQRINFDELEVLIYNDGSKVRLKRRCLKKYPFKIRYYKGKTNLGVALAREELFKLSTAPYIMYCDADDCFYTIFSLLHIFKEINNGGFDVLVSNFFEEVVDDFGNELLVIHRCDKVFIHGKVFRKSYLEGNSIHWINICPSEDNYYNKLAMSLSDDVKYIELPIYLWRWRNDSIVRKEKERWQLKNFPVGVESEALLIEELIRRGKQGNANYFIALEMYSMFFSLERPIWREEGNKMYFTVALLKARNFYKKYKSIWDRIPKEDKQAIYQANVKAQLIRGFDESKNIDDWLNMLSVDGIIDNANKK